MNHIIFILFILKYYDVNTLNNYYLFVDISHDYINIFIFIYYHLSKVYEL